MKVKARFGRGLLLATMLIAVASLVVFAAPLYVITLTIAETSGNSYTNLPIIVAVNNQGLVDQGYLGNGLDAKVDDGTAYLPRMITDNMTLFVSGLPANTAKNFNYTLHDGNLTASMPIVIGHNGYFTIPDTAIIEPGNNWEMALGPINTTSGNKNIFDKGSIGANVTASGVVLAYANNGTATITTQLSGVASGSHLDLMVSGGLLSVSTNTSSNSTAFSGNVTDNANSWNVGGNDVFSYLNYLTMYRPGASIPGTIHENLQTDINDYGFVDDVNWEGQTFTANATYTLATVYVNVSKVGDPGNFRLGVYNTAGGLPAGVALGIGTANTSGWINTGNPAIGGSNWTAINIIPPVSITSGTMYAETFSTAIGGGAKVWVDLHDAAPDFVGGTGIFSGDGGTTWGAYGANFDYLFQNWSAPTSSNTTTILDYYPQAVIQGNVLPDLQNTANATITWGVNPAGVAVTVSQTILSENQATLNNVTPPSGGSLLNILPEQPPSLFTEHLPPMPDNTPSALFWYPFFFFGICIIGLLIYEATAKTGGEGSLATMCVVMWGLMMALGIIGATNSSNVIPLFPAILFILPAAALTMSRRHVGWG